MSNQFERVDGTDLMFRKYYLFEFMFMDLKKREAAVGARTATEVKDS